jgi:hypothetical protein
VILDEGRIFWTTGRGTLAKATTENEASLTRLIREGYKTVEDIAYLTSRSWIRASGLAMLCPREEVICSQHKVKRTWEISADLNLIFQHGHGLHARLQDHILPDIGVLRGKWVCNGCGSMHGGPVEDGMKPEDWAVARPDDEPCSCGSTDYRFHEMQFTDDELRVSGHCDGFLQLPHRPDLGILEAKSINKSWQIVNVPKLEHAVQTHIYMWLTGCQWGVILYWVKSENGVGGLVEHFLERDEETIDQIKASIKSIWNGIETGSLPERLCASDDCKRALDCAVRDICFAPEEGDADF